MLDFKTPTVITKANKLISKLVNILAKELNGYGMEFCYYVSIRVCSMFVINILNNLKYPDKETNKIWLNFMFNLVNRIAIEKNLITEDPLSEQEKINRGNL